MKLSQYLSSILPIVAICLLASIAGCEGKRTADSSTNNSTSNTTSDKASPKNPASKKVVEKLFDDDVPLGLEPLPYPADNVPSESKIALGRKLFFDPMLSGDNTISCSTCHDPEKGWADGKVVAEGIGNQKGKRNTISIVNSAYSRRYFWDGRAKSLEAQSLIPIFTAHEMGLESEAELLLRVSEHHEYPGLFADSFEDGVTMPNIAKAIASFERTILLGDTPYDRYQSGDKSALSESAVRGMKIFFNDRRGNCAGCHAAPLFSDMQFYNTGIGVNEPEPDLGFHVTMGWGFKSAFRTPSLRGIIDTAPYMHDGSLETLEDVVDYYNRGGNRNPNIDAGVKRLRLSKQNKTDLVAFLREGFGSFKSQSAVPQ
jgi:cytochrome c peroxidase